MSLVTLGEIDQAIESADAPEKIESLMLAAAVEDLLPPDRWLAWFFRSYVRAPFADHHRDLWDWVWSVEKGRRSRPFFAIWPRGGAKSASVEMACVALGQRRVRRYGLYVSRIQTRADDHVANIGDMLASPRLARRDPDLCKRAVGEYGTSKGWKRNRLWTAAGFVIDALGLDTATRGARLGTERPDLIVLDDIDEATDSPGVVASMLTRITRSILPAGSDDLIVMGAQNMVNPDGVFAQIIDGRAEMLGDSIISGPIPALVGSFSIDPNPDYEPNDLDQHFEQRASRPWVITGGTPTWAGQDIDACERLLANFGPSAFRIECQHEKRRAIGGMYDDVLDSITHVDRAQVPDLVRKTVWLDPATTDTDGSDSQGCQCDGIDAKGVIYRLRSWEQRASPGDALRVAITWAYEEGIDHVGVEMNVGADMSGRSVKESWTHAFNQQLEDFLADLDPDHPWARRPPPILLRQVATSGLGSKQDRSSTMHVDYERPGRIVHVIDPTESYHEVLEAALSRAFVVKPFDLADSAYWAWRHLRRNLAGSTSRPKGAFAGATPATSYAERHRQQGPAAQPGRVVKRRSTPDNPFGR